MIADDITINLSPYLGCSKNLIEFFAIIGYEEEAIKALGKNFMQNQDKLDLTFLSIEISDFSFEIASDYIIKQVYPDKPAIIKSEKCPPSDSIIFSSCIDSVDGKKKVFYSCYAFRFYEKIETRNNEICFIPKAFLIYSQYPYFSCFSRICEKIFDSIDETCENIKIPIEIFIHCFVNYFPSPLYSSITLKDFSPHINMPELTGYPYADFNLPKVINCVGLNDFIKIYILIFLELDLLFFSPNLEKLNIFMFALYLLNYPLTDSNYFWFIKTISKNDLKNGDDTVSTSFRGVNSEIDQNINLSSFKVLNYIIDLENKKQPIIPISEDKENEDINSLLKYIHLILNKKLFLKKTFLFEAVLKLQKKLKIILKEYNEKAQDDANIAESFFYINGMIKEKNREIQAIFYDFILNMLVELNKDYKLDPTFKFPVVKKIEDNPKLNEEEKIFLHYSRNTIKYNTYFQNFLSDFNVYDGIKLSLLFSDEFVNLKKKENYKKIESENKINYFKIMDEFFTKKNVKSFDLRPLRDEKNFFRFNIKGNGNKLKLFTLKKDIIKKFIYSKKNKSCFQLLKAPENINFETRTKSSFHFTIQYYFMKKKILGLEYYLRGSVQYIIATCFPLFSANRLESVLIEYLLNTIKMNFFERYYIFLILNAINKYYRLNQQKNTFPEMNSKNTKKYYEIIQNHLSKNDIIQDELIFNFFNKNKPIEEEPKINNGDFSYVCDDTNFSNDLKSSIKLTDKEILYNRNGTFINFSRKSFDEIPLFFQESYSYYESCYTNDFDVINLNVLEIAEKVANLILIYNKLNNEKDMIQHLFYLLNCLMLYKDKVHEYEERK